MVVVLCLNNGERDVGFMIEDYIRSLSLSTGGFIALNKNPAVGKVDFFPDLPLAVPAGFENCRDDVFGDDVPFRQVLFGWHSSIVQV